MESDKFYFHLDGFLIFANNMNPIWNLRRPKGAVNKIRI